MANEITYRGKLAFLKGDSSLFDFGDLTATMTGSKALRGRQTVTTAEEALILGEVAAGLAWFICKNLDATNTLRIKLAAGAANFVDVPPGEVSGPYRFNALVTAPVVTASAATVDFIYLLVSA
jgi:hypothetical protein